jgi:signal transduction histidine kinase
MSRVQRLPVRWRLAIISAGLTFAIVIGLFTARQVRSSFDDDLKLTAVDLADRLHPRPTIVGLLHFDQGELAQLAQQAAAGDAVIRIVEPDGDVIAESAGTPNLGNANTPVHTKSGYRVVSRPLTDQFARPVAYLQYAKPMSHVEHTIHRVRAFLFFGVIAGTVLALLAGLALARRAMSPVRNLTRTAKLIARTRDPAVAIPKPVANDEVADLARTLEEMLVALDQARGETQAALDRQREFVADASHELRTPLTSILANLELLNAELEGEEQDIAGSALRSSRRMRRLVADLLLLARADAGREAAREPVDLGAVVREAAGEAAPLAEGHVMTVEVENGDPLVVEGSADELHRLVVNLIQNALVHTPAGTAVDVRTRRERDEIAFEVSDEGPGIPAELRPRIFERFVRGAGDRNGGSGSGLGLSIVRAVAESHGGSVELSDNEDGGARFVVRLPAVRAEAPVTPPQPQAAP